MRNAETRRVSATHRDMCRTVPSIRAKEKARIRKERDRMGPCVLMRDDHCCADETVDLGQAAGPVDPPSFPRLQATAIVVFAVWRSPLGKLDIARRQDGKGDPIWLNSKRKTVRIVHPRLTSPAFTGRVSLRDA